MASLEDPEEPVVVQAFLGTTAARDVAFDEHTLAVAMGAGGVDVFDRSEDPMDPQWRAHIDTAGTAGAVDLVDGLLAVADWTSVRLYDLADPTAPLSVGGERPKTSPKVNQLYGVTLQPPYLFAAEWEGMFVYRYDAHVVGPQLWVPVELIDFGVVGTQGSECPGQPGTTTCATRALILRNEGMLPLHIEGITTTVGFSATPATLTIAAQGVGVVEVTYQSTGSATSKKTGTLTIASNDPDQPLFKVHVQGDGSAGLLDVGELLDEDFAFLDPTGEDKLENLTDSVIVLAYFATF